MIDVGMRDYGEGERIGPRGKRSGPLLPERAAVDDEPRPSAVDDDARAADPPRGAPEPDDGALRFLPVRDHLDETYRADDDDERDEKPPVVPFHLFSHHSFAFQVSPDCVGLGR
jgi:hypothetical protein